MALVDCPECGRSISDSAISCPHCGYPLRGGSMQRGYAIYAGYEFRSGIEMFGLPLIHVATGVDPKTGRKRIAKGIIAIGDIAVGALAIGGVAFGGITIGGLSLGLASLGGAAIAVFAGFGGLAVGYIAVGGMAIGYYAAGGLALGAHTLSGVSQDPAAIEFFNQWFRNNDWNVR